MSEYQKSIQNTLKQTDRNNVKRVKFDINNIIKSMGSKGESTDEVLDKLYTLNMNNPYTESFKHFFYGFNHMQTPMVLPHNQDQMGYTFFTKPRFNLTASNLAGTSKGRILSQLLNENSLSLARVVRNTLDPVIAKDTKNHYCPLVDPDNVFITWLSNSIQSMSNPPSTTMDVYSSQPGKYKEVFSMADGHMFEYGSYNITCTFRAVQGNPHLLLFRSWMTMMAMQFLDDGPLPYPDDRQNNRMNYNTRIYRLIMDNNRKSVQHIWAPMYAFPVGMETGSLFGFDSSKTFIDSFQTTDIQFQCVGSFWDDPLLMYQFNVSVGLMNKFMRDEYRAKQMVKIPQELRNIANNIGYPYINMKKDNELEWWISKEQYESLKPLIKMQQHKPVSNNVSSNRRNVAATRTTRRNRTRPA